MGLGTYSKEFLEQSYANGDIAAQVPDIDDEGEIIGVKPQYFKIKVQAICATEHKDQL